MNCITNSCIGAPNVTVTSTLAIPPQLGNIWKEHWRSELEPASGHGAVAVRLLSPHFLFSHYAPVRFVDPLLVIIMFNLKIDSHSTPTYPCPGPPSAGALRYRLWSEFFTLMLLIHTCRSPRYRMYAFTDRAHIGGP